MSIREIDLNARFQCRHILADGRRCRAACLRREEFCYYHHTSRKPVHDPIGRHSRRFAFTLPPIEDRASLQAALNDIVARIAANGIDSHRASKILYAIQIASSNLPRRAASKPLDSDKDSGQVERIVHHHAYGEVAPRLKLATSNPAKSSQGQGQPPGNEMDADEALNMADFSDVTDLGDNIPQSGNLQTEFQNQLEAAREELESREDRIHVMHAELARCREDLAKSQAQTAEARADTLRAEEGMVWQMDRQNELRFELEALKLATETTPLDDSGPETLDIVQAVAHLPLSSFDEVGGSACSSNRGRVPHVRDGFIVANVGIERSSTAPANTTTNPSLSRPQIRHSERSSTRSLRRTQPKNPATAHATHTARTTLSQMRSLTRGPVPERHRRASLATFRVPQQE